MFVYLVIANGFILFKLVHLGHIDNVRNMVCLEFLENGPQSLIRVVLFVCYSRAWD